MKRRSFLAVTGLGHTGWRPRPSTDTVDEPPWWRDVEAFANYELIDASPSADAMILGWSPTGTASCVIDLLDYDDLLSPTPRLTTGVTRKTFIDIVGDVPTPSASAAVVIDFEDSANVKVYAERSVRRDLVVVASRT
jgi:hypothetical protein